MTQPIDAMKIHRIKEELRDQMADVLIDALKRQCGVILNEQEYYRLRERISAVLIGEIRV